MIAVCFFYKSAFVSITGVKNLADLLRILIGFSGAAWLELRSDLRKKLSSSSCELESPTSYWLDDSF